MFYVNTDVAEHIRKNLYIFIVMRENLIDESITDFTCHVNVQNKDSEPYQVYIDYTIKYADIDDDDDVVHRYVRNCFKMKYSDFMKFDKKYSDFAQDLMEEKLRTELLDYVDRHKIVRETRLYEIPKELLLNIEPETNVFVAIDEFNQKIENLHKHLEQLFESDHPNDLTGFNAVDLNALKTISLNGGYGTLTFYIYLGIISLKDKKLEYEYNLLAEPYREFIGTFDEIANDEYLSTNYYDDWVILR